MLFFPEFESVRLSVCLLTLPLPLFLFQPRPPRTAGSPLPRLLRKRLIQMTPMISLQCRLHHQSRKNRPLISAAICHIRSCTPKGRGSAAAPHQTQRWGGGTWAPPGPLPTKAFSFLFAESCELVQGTAMGLDLDPTQGSERRSRPHLLCRIQGNL